MAPAMYTLIALLIIQNVFCAPNNADVIDDPSDSEPKLNDEPYSTFDDSKSHHNKKQGQRQKRYYPSLPYNFQPPPLYYGQTYTGSDISRSLSEIQSTLREVINMVATPPPPPQPTIYPVYVPIYIPQAQCSCPSSNDQGPKTVEPTPTTTTTTEAPVDSFVPTLSDRFPDMEDERQNWGLLVNNTVADTDEDDGSRPISLGKIVPSDVAGPSVEHGSVQADMNNPGVPPAVALGQPEVASQTNSMDRLCDTAVVSCCLGPEKGESNKCVQSRGCRDRSLGNNPCQPQSLLKSITRLQKYYS